MSLPTPGVAALAPRLGATAAGVVSASHNPFADNGIKFFSGEGRKLPSGREREIEELTSRDEQRPTGDAVGTVEVLGDATRLYVEGVLARLRPTAGGLKVLLDCANGAAHEAAPLAFAQTGADLTVTGADPTGTNINEGCGSTHVEELDASGHDVAFAFDGDADRVLAVDEKGSVVDGDRIIAILARDRMERGALSGGVVVTVMSNLGFFKAMEALGVTYEVTPVGDRHVAEAMGRLGASVGGEQSGHVILSEHTTTGDGLVTALALVGRDGPHGQAALGAGAGDGGVPADAYQREDRGAWCRQGRRRLRGGREGGVGGREQARRGWAYPSEAERDGARGAGYGRAYGRVGLPGGLRGDRGRRLGRRG